MKISKVKINGMTNPIGYSFESVRVAWLVTETKAKKADYAKIEISLDAGFQTIVYVKEGAGLNSAGEKLLFTPMPRIRYYVRVQVKADNGETAVSAEKAFFETAKMREEWMGKWIKPQKSDHFHPTFEKEFTAEKPVKKARLYISGLGLYAARLNGKKIGEEVLTPYYSDYHTECQYQTYNITSMIRCDESGRNHFDGADSPNGVERTLSDQEKTRNKIEVSLGNGWYKGKFGLNGKTENFGSEFQMIAEIHLQYEDGSVEVIPSDDTWKYRGSNTEGSDIYDGEIVNRVLWEKKENPLKTPVYGEIEGKLVERYSLPVLEKEELPVREVIHTPAGETVLDFGQNFAGYVAFHAKGLSKGTKVVLDFGEILQDGNFYNENYRAAKAQFIYVSDGREEWVKPSFTFFGFRYVRVSGWEGTLHAEDFVGKVLYSDMEITGTIETGHAKVNRLFLNALWGQKSNSIDFPTDCPQRDERLGWTGDCQVFSGTASYNMDTAAFYNKFLHDLRTEQVQLDGILPGVIPVWEKDAAIFSSVWGDIATFLPTVLYEHYGDLEALRSYYPMMKDWVDKITREDQARGQKYLFDFSNQLGDWLALDGRTEQSNAGGTDEYYIGSCYYAESVKKVADAAKALGKTKEESNYRALYQHIYDAILEEYYTKTGRLSIDTQTGYIVALYTGIYPDKERVIEGLKGRLYKDCYKLKGGFVGAPIMCRVMAENGMEEEAFYFLLQEGYPGWLHCVDLGATTIWERWNSVLDNGLLSGTMMNSLNHYAYGAIVEYLYRDVAGIKALEPGFKKVEISPLVNQKLKYMKAAYRSAYGTYRSEWKILKDGKVHVEIEIPFGGTAVIGLPFYPEEPIGELPAGVYAFTYQPTEDLRCRYTKKTLFKDMMQDERAVQIIERVSPLLQYFLSSGNEDFLHESLTTLQNMSYMGFSEEEIRNLTEELMKLYED